MQVPFNRPTGILEYIGHDLLISYLLPDTNPDRKQAATHVIQQYLRGGREAWINDTVLYATILELEKHLIERDGTDLFTNGKTAIRWLLLPILQCSHIQIDKSDIWLKALDYYVAWNVSIETAITVSEIEAIPGLFGELIASFSEEFENVPFLQRLIPPNE